MHGPPPLRLCSKAGFSLLPWDTDTQGPPGPAALLTCTQPLGSEDARYFALCVLAIARGDDAALRIAFVDLLNDRAHSLERLNAAALSVSAQVQVLQPFLPLMPASPELNVDNAFAGRDPATRRGRGWCPPG